MNAGFQDRAVIREWREALEDGDVALASRIETANPDLFTRRGVFVVPKGEA